MFEVRPFNPNEWVACEDKKFSVTIIADESFHMHDSVGSWSVLAIPYRYRDKEKCYWKQLKFVVMKNDEVYMELYRNYPSSVPFVYISQNNKEYFITSLDYQCITIINLTDKTQNSYCFGDHDKGWGFCPIGIEIEEENDDGSFDLRIHGCYWGGPYEYFYIRNIKDLDNFEKPDNVEMFREDEDDGEED